MKISQKQFINLPVYTQSGERLGKVESFNIETDSQSILEYKIKPANIVAGFIKGDFVIPRGQIIEINNKKMVVEDLSIQTRKPIKNKQKDKQKVTAGAVMKENS